MKSLLDYFRRIVFVLQDLKKKMKLGIFLEFFLWPLLGVKGYSEHLNYIEHALVPLTQRMIE